MSFLQEAEPPRGVALDVLPGIRRVVARNPSVMTYLGTNTYLIDGEDGLTVIDPGPKRGAPHVEEVLQAAGNVPIRRILLTHTHIDHWGATEALQKAIGAPVYAYKTSARAEFTPDMPLDDGDHVVGFTALHTPGHAADHLCFEYLLKDGRKILFSGDHVMSWSSSIVSPPDGDMLAYYRSLERLLDRDDALYLSGHGPTLPEPRKLVRQLLAHRQHRERTILEQLRQTPWSVAELAARLYNKTDPFLKIAAQRNVLAHLLKLRDENIAQELEPATTLPNGAPDIVAPPGESQTENIALMQQLHHDALRRFGLL